VGGDDQFVGVSVLLEIVEAGADSVRCFVDGVGVPVVGIARFRGV
jgi:hypothetical protein